jgi:hypothetical protein
MAARPVPSPPGIGRAGDAALAAAVGAGTMRALSSARLPGTGGLAGRVTTRK